MENQIPQTLRTFFLFVGTVPALGIIVSYVLEPSAWFQALSANGKRWRVLLLAGGLPLVSWALLTFVPPGLLDQLEGVYTALLVMATGLFSSQLYHKYINVPTVTIEAEAIEESDDYDDDF